MTKTTTRMLLAASLAPLPLFAEEQASIPTECLAGLVAPAKIPAMTLQQRAELFAAAAVLPADMDMALVLSRGEQGKNQDKYLITFPAIPHAGSIAIGLAKGAGNTLASLRAFQILMQIPEASENAAAEWQEAARESLKELISRAAENIKQQSRAQAAQMAEKIAIQPIYLISSPKAGEENEFRQSMKFYGEFLPANAAAIPHAKSIEVDGLRGVQLTPDEAIGLACIEDSDHETDILLRELSKRSL